MPIYEYECTNCKDVFERQYKIDDRNIPIETPCELCGGEIQIKLNALGFVDPLRIGLRKPPGWFSDKIKEIKKKHPLGNL